MRNVAVLINERKRRMESLEKLAAWQQRVEGWEVSQLQLWKYTDRSPTLQDTMNVIAGDNRSVVTALSYLPSKYTSVL
jgi:hypothetical protein